jgi:coenzyme F420-reducing hydrogenase delta subunit/ferredoxin
LDNGTVTLAFTDEYTREPFQLAPDLLVVDETIQPPRYLTSIANVFKLHTDPEGFLQKENVHRVGVFTNRRGIYAAGPARGVASSAVQRTEADDVSLVIVQQHRNSEKANPQAAEIDPHQCVRCLTCLRLCPYGAITLNTKPCVMPTACEGCGLCRAECPRQAIFLAPLEQANLLEQAGLGLEQGTVAPGNPRMVAFCCSRSAAQAGHMATCMGQTTPPNLSVVEVPCAGGISIRHILGAFEMGADGVLVLTCHTDNCHSEYGNQYAHARVHQLQGTLQSIGLDAKRLHVRTLASNMGFEFAQIVNQFERELKG